MSILISENTENIDYIDFTIDGELVSALKRITTARLNPDNPDEVIVHFNTYQFPSHAPQPLFNEPLLTFLNGNRKTLRLIIAYTIVDIGTPPLGSGAELLALILNIIGVVATAASQIYIDALPFNGFNSTPSGLINGVNTQFIASQGVYDPLHSKIWLNGNLLSPGAGRLTLTDPGTGKYDIANPPPKTGNTIVHEYTKP